MADTLTTQSSTPATIPASTVIATDDAGASGHVQVVKLAVSTDGSATPLTADNTNGLLVNLGANNDVTVTGSVTASAGTNLNTSALALETGGNLAAAVTALQTIDNFISGSRGLVTEDNSAAALASLQLLDDAIATIASAITAKGFAIAGTDGTNARVIKTDTSGELQVDVLTMPTVAVTQSGTWDEVGINDSGNSITVDNGGTFATQATLQTGDNTIGRVKLTDGTDVADILDLSNSNPLTVAIVDGSGSQITSFGGGTQYTEADTDTSITGTAVLWEDTSDTLRVASAAKPLPVNVVAGGAGDGSILDGVDTGIKATVLDYSNSNPLAVRLSDTNGDYVGAGAGTQYTEDAGAAANPTGTALILIREDARAGSLTTTDGDNVAARGNNKGELYVKTTDSDALLGTIDADTGNISTKIDTLAGAVSGTEMQVDVLTMPTVAVTQSGTWDEVGINDSGNSITVDNGGTFVTQENGALLTAAQLIDDIVYTDDTSTHSTGSSKGALIMAAATPTDTAVNANDIGAVGMTNNRALYVSVQDALPAGTAAIGKLAANSGVDIGDVDILSIAAGDNNIGNVDIVSGTITTVTTLTGGGVAHDSPDGATNPVKVGAKASATLSDDTMVANADRIDLTGDLDGALYVRNVPLGDLIAEAVSNTDGASTALTNFGATASTRNYVTSITAFRTDTGTTLAYIDFRDGTGGSVLYRLPLPPAGGVTINNGGNPLFYTTANTALAYDVSAALSTIYISLSGFKSKVRA